MTHYQQLKSFLRQIVNISDEDFNELGAVLQEKRFRKREIITGAGDIENYLYFVAKGLVRIFFLKGKREITYDIVKEGSITGSVSSFLTGKPSRYIVETMEPSVVLVLANKDLEELYTKDNKWEKFGRLITTNFILKQERGILDGVRYTPKERFLFFVENYPEFIQRVPQKYLASFLGIKPETFSRMKKHLMVRQNNKNNHKKAI